MDLEQIDFVLANAKLLGSKGTTGTQASFMELFEGDTEKVKKLDNMIAEEAWLQWCICCKQVRLIQESLILYL